MEESPPFFRVLFRLCLFLMARPTAFVLAAFLLLGVGLASPKAFTDAARSSTAEDVRPTDTLRSTVEPIAAVRRDSDRDAVPDRIGDTVTVAGRVTAGRDELPVAVSNFAVLQDTTGGLHVLLPNGPTVERGDSLHIRGILEHRYGLTQLEGLEYETVEAPPRVPTPIPLTVSAAANDQYEGRLVRVRGRITTKSENEGGKYLLIADRTPEATAQITVFVAHQDATRISLDPLEEGDRVEVTGVLGQHDYNAPYVDYYQVQPRTQADLAHVRTVAPYVWWALYVLGGGALLAAIGLIVLRTTVRRRTRELRESKARFRGLTNSVPGIIFQIAVPTGNAYEFRFVSERANEILGLSPDKRQFFERFCEQVPLSHREALATSLGTAAEEEKLWRFEFPFETRAGEQIWLWGAATPQRRNETLLFNGVFLDITERKRAEAKAQRQTKVLRRITKGCSLQDVLGELIEEIEAERPGMLGSVLLYDSADNVIQHGAAPNLPDEYNRAVEGIEVGPATGSCGSAMHSGSPVIAEDIETDPRWEGYRDLALKHNLHACWSVPIRDSEGQILGSFAMYYRAPEAPSETDWALIEEARSLARIAIERHRDSEQLRLLTEAVEQSTEAVMITEGAPLDPPGPRIEYVNTALQEMTGYLKDELIGQTPRLLQGSETDPEVLSSLRNALEAGETWEGETINYRRNGTPYRVRWSIAPVHDDQGNIQHWVSVQRDVSEQRRREQELKEAKDAAEEAARLKSAMLANMSHEIRTPLTSIIGFAEVLGEDTPQETSTRDLARLIEKSGQRLLETLDTVLTLSKLEAGQMELSEESVNVVEEIREAAEQFTGKAEEAELHLHIEASDESVWAHCDRGGLQIVLHNVLSNAVKYSETGGRVWLRAYSENQRAVLEVEDTGIGIDEEKVEELFEPFRQASEGIARKYEGTGLGLAVTREAVHQMGGSIEVETGQDEGTCFTVRLPKDQPPPSAASQTGNGRMKSRDDSP